MGWQGVAGNSWLVPGSVANTGMKWVDSARGSVGDQWGRAPTRVEPVAASLTLRDLAGAVAVTLQSLDGCGQPVGELQRFSSGTDGFEIRLPAEPATLWYLIEVSRGSQPRRR